MSEEEIIKISSWIEDHAREIAHSIEPESIEVYNFLQKEFKTSDVSKNHLFQFVFRSFYRLDNAGLSTDFKKEYYIILEEVRHKKPFDFKNILSTLYEFPTKKGHKSVQFSFVSKMLSTIDNTMPVYDSEVARMFSLRRPSNQKEKEDRIAIYLNHFDQIRMSYKVILEKSLIPKATHAFDLKFSDNKLTPMKKLDFIFWSAGKIKSAETKTKRKKKKAVTLK